MHSQTFFSPVRSFSLREIAEIGGCTLEKDASAELMISDIATLESASQGQLSFMHNTKYLNALRTCQASACIVPHALEVDTPASMVLLYSENPYASYARIATAFYPESVAISNPTIAATAVISKTARLGKGCSIGEHCYIGDHVVIGDACVIESNVTITHAHIGHRVKLASGVRIGQSGFGFATDKGQHITVPQLGAVEIGDDVNIGANTTIDRGTIGNTIIGDGCRIDNLVQIGHNVQMGRGCVIVAQVGISGSVKLEDYVVLAGQVGIAGHITIGKGASVAAQSGVMHNVPAGKKYGGSPALPIVQWHKQNVILKKLINKKESQ